MARRTLPPDLSGKLIKLCGMFGSDHEGERASAARLADQLLKQHGLSWEAVLSASYPAVKVTPVEPIPAQPDPADKLKLDIMECVGQAAMLSRDQIAFLDHFRKRVFRGETSTAHEVAMFNLLYEYAFGVKR